MSKKDFQGAMHAMQSKFGQYQLREWSDFFDRERFGIPEPKVALERAVTNINYYAINYGIICSIFALFMIFFQPFLILAFLFGVIIFVGTNVLLKNKEKNFHIKAEENQGFIGIFAFVLTLGIVFIVGGVMTYVGIVFMSGFVIAHAFLRKRSAKSKVLMMNSNLSADPKLPRDVDDLKGALKAVADNVNLADVNSFMNNVKEFGKKIQ